MNTERVFDFAITGDADALPALDKALRAAGGIMVSDVAPDRVRGSYDIRDTNCADVVRLIESAGVARDLNRRDRLRLALRCYREAILREDLNNEIGWDSFVREIYVSRYRHRRHGRRDDRPHHWRQYAARKRAD